MTDDMDPSPPAPAGAHLPPTPTDRSAPEPHRGGTPVGRAPTPGRVPAAWTVTVLLAAIVAVRLTHMDRWTVTVGAIALLPLLLFLAWPVAAWAWVRRRWALAAAATALVGVHLWWVVPEFNPLGSGPSVEPGALRLRIFDANVDFQNSDVGGIAGEIARDHPDVVSLEEVTAPQLHALHDTGAFRRYRWHFVDPRPNANGAGIWSTVPLQGAGVWYAEGHPELEAWLAPPGRPRIRLLTVHTYAPIEGMTTSVWRAQLADIAREAGKVTGPEIVMGDFNATWDMWEFQNVLARNLHDAAVVAGRGWEMTWSRQWPIIPPLIRIDHILVSSTIAVPAFRLGDGRGSDHRPIVATLAVNPPARSR